jgi:hypothetical protein
MDLSKLSDEELLKLAKITPKIAEEVSKETCLSSTQESKVRVLDSAPISEKKPINNEKIIPMKIINCKKLNLSPTELILKQISFHESKDFVSQFHYSKTMPMNTKIGYGFYYQNKLMVVITFGAPIGRSVISWLKIPIGTCLELTRVASLDSMPKNTESYCIGKSLKQLKIDLPQIKYLISYADTNEGHCGYIYQASNWKYIGLQPQIMIAERFFIDGKEIHSRNLNSMHGTTNTEELYKIYGNRIAKTYGVKKHIYILHRK